MIGLFFIFSFLHLFLYNIPLQNMLFSFAVIAGVVANNNDVEFIFCLFLFSF